MKNIFKIKYLPFMLLILMSIYSCSKEKPLCNIYSSFDTYTYHLEGACIDMLDSDSSVISEERDAYIEVINFRDTTLSIQNIARFKNFIIFNFNDNLLIPVQYFKDIDGSQGSFEAIGKIKDDSLFLRYKYSSHSEGSWNCDCKGKLVQRNKALK